MTVITNVSTVVGVMSKKYTAASTSNADKIIDALDEVRSETKTPSYVCNNCNSTEYIVRSPLGGYKIKICARCKSKSYSSRANIAPLLAANKPHDQGTARGPIKTEAKPKTDKHQPTYRHKGKKR